MRKVEKMFNILIIIAKIPTISLTNAISIKKAKNWALAFFKGVIKQFEKARPFISKNIWHIELNFSQIILIRMKSYSVY